MPMSIFSGTPLEPQAGSLVNDAANTGYDSKGWPRVTCEFCGGRGWYWAPVSIDDMVAEKCQPCNGFGFVFRIVKRAPGASPGRAGEGVER